MNFKQTYHLYQNYNKEDFLLNIKFQDLSDIILEYFENHLSDKNREDIICQILNLNHIAHRYGYDAVQNNNCYEIKCQNSKTKLNGAITFSMLTWKKFRKYIKDDLIILVGGFYKNKLLYILSFNFNDLKDIFETKLKKHLKNEKFQSMMAVKVSLGFNSYHDHCKVLYVNENIKYYKKYITEKIYKKLLTCNEA